MERRMVTKVSAFVLAVAMLVVTGCSGNVETKSPAGAAGKATVVVKPDNAPEVRDQAIDLIKQGKVDEATANLQQVTKVTPKDAQAQFILGIAFYNKKQYNEAIEAYKKAIDLDSKMVEAYNNIGNAYRDAKDYTQAITWYEKALSIDPQFVFSYNNLAGLYVTQDQKTEAIKVLERGVAARPSNMDLKLYLANLYKDTNQKDKALAIVDGILAENADYGPAQKLAEELKK